MIEEKIEELLPVSFEYTEHKEKYNIACEVCGELMTKTISIKHRVDMIPDYFLLNEQKQKIKNKKYICNSCKKKIIGKAKNYLITEWIKNNYKQEKYLYHSFIEFPKLRDKIIKHYDKEYLIRSISRGYYLNSFYVEAYRISKDKPYELGQSTGFYTENIKECKIVDDTLANRRERYKQLKSEHVIVSMDKYINGRTYEKE